MHLFVNTYVPIFPLDGKSPARSGCHNHHLGRGVIATDVIHPLTPTSKTLESLLIASSHAQFPHLPVLIATAEQQASIEFHTRSRSVRPPRYSPAISSGISSASMNCQDGPSLQRLEAAGGLPKQGVPALATNLLPQQGERQEHWPTPPPQIEPLRSLVCLRLRATGTLLDQLRQHFQPGIFRFEARLAIQELVTFI